jgi:hypothetical protein
MEFQVDRYQIIRNGVDTVMRTKTAPDGVAYNADVNPNFYAWGLVDAANIIVNGSCQSSTLALAPNGTVTHD